MGRECELILLRVHGVHVRSTVQWTLEIARKYKTGTFEHGMYVGYYGNHSAHF